MKMTNEQFQKRFKKLQRERLVTAGLGGAKLTLNEVVFILRGDDGIPDYLLNYKSEDSFCFGFLKEGFIPVRDLAKKVNLMECDWPDDAEVPTLYIEFV